MRPNAVSTTADSAIRLAIVRPTTVVIGIAALRSTWRRTIVRRGRPRLTAVCTCSRSSSSRTAVLVTRVTSATDEAASARAGRIRWCERVDEARRRLPAPGTSGSFTANTNCSTTAAAKAGIAADTVEEISTPLSMVPCDSAPTIPSPTPITTMIDRGQQHQAGGDPDPLADQGRDALVQRDRLTEVAVQGRDQPVPVADQERVVEVVLRVQLGHHLRERVPDRRSAWRSGSREPGRASRRPRSSPRAG